MLEQISLGSIAAGIAFVVALIGGVAVLRQNIRNAISSAVRPEIEEISKKITAIQSRIEDMDDEQQRCRADNSRRHILTYNDELLRHTMHSKESFDQILADIDSYEDYSYNHPTYPNNKAKMAIENIKRCYAKCIEEETFLQ